MKRIGISLIGLMLCANFLMAQTKPVEKATFKTPQVQCEEGKLYLEERMIREYGITAVNANFQKRSTTVTWLTDRTTAENIKVIFSYLGFDADDVTADEIAFKKLPACCKKPIPQPKQVPNADSIKAVQSATLLDSLRKKNALDSVNRGSKLGIPSKSKT